MTRTAQRKEQRETPLHGSESFTASPDGTIKPPTRSAERIQPPLTILQGRQPRSPTHRGGLGTKERQTQCKPAQLRSCPARDTLMTHVQPREQTATALLCHIRLRIDAVFYVCRKHCQRYIPPYQISRHLRSRISPRSCQWLYGSCNTILNVAVFVRISHCQLT